MSFEVLQIAVSGYLVGLIWLIQLIHYPAFRHIDMSSWGQFHHTHSAVMGLLAGGPMIISLLVGLWLAYDSGDMRQYVVLGCEILAWIVTFGLSVPEHPFGHGQGPRLNCSSHSLELAADVGVDGQARGTGHSN